MIAESPLADAKPIVQGVFIGMPDADYRAIPALSKSELWRWAFGGGPGRKAADIGNAFDLLVTQRHLVKANPDAILCGPKADRRTAAGKAEWAAFVASHPDSLVLTAAEFDMLRQMISSVREHDQLGPLMEAASPETTQGVVVWWDDELCLWCKSKFDQITERSIIDWKTSSAASAEEFKQHATVFGYHVQDAAYLRGFRKVTGENRRFIFAIGSKRPDRGCPAYWTQLDEKLERCGEEWFLSLGGRWAESVTDDHPYKLRI